MIARDDPSESLRGESSLHIEPTPALVTVVFNEEVVAASTSCLYVLQADDPPVYYFPREHICTTFIEPTSTRSSCRDKGIAKFFSLKVGERRVEDAAWTCEQPSEAALLLKNHLAFDVNRVDAIYVNQQRCRPNK